MELDSFFESDIWNSLAIYEKQRYENIYNNYMEMLKLGIDIPKPDFLIREKNLKVSDKINTSPKPKKKKTEKIFANIKEYEKLEKIFGEIAEKGFRHSELLFSKNKFDSINELVIELEINIQRLTKQYEDRHRVVVVDSIINSDTSSKGRRYPKRNVRQVNYTEYEIPEDYFIYCDRCRREWEGSSCPRHGPLLDLNDTKVSVNLNDCTRARRTVPDGWVAIRKSGIPDAGDGVWTVKSISIGVRFGPYEGQKIKIGNNHGYCWEIRKDGRVSHCIDGQNEAISNWMRYVNCSRNIVEQNLVAYQYLGNIYYRTVKDISAHTELLVWYGDDFGKQLGIDLKAYHIPTNDLKKIGFECAMCQLNFSSPIFLEQHKLRCKKSRITMCAVNNQTGGIREVESENKSNCVNLPENLQNNVCSTTDTSKRINEIKFISKTATINKITVDDNNSNSNSNSNSNNNNNNDNKSKLLHYCTYCKRSFIDLDKLKQHIHKSHETTKQFLCQLCEKSFSLLGNLKIHIQGVHEHKKHICNICNRSFTKLSYLKIHIQGVHEHKKFNTCNYCNKSFSLLGNLKTHIQGVHEHKKHICNICNKSFTRLGDLKRHIQGVHEHKKHTCNICNKSFSQLRYLKLHIQGVHEHKKHTCNYCNKSFSQLGYLKTHIQSVHEHKKHKCNICNNTFSQLCSLKLHIQSVHEHKKHICNYCNKSFTQLGYLKLHIQSVHEHKKHICNICNKSFSQLNSLKLHIQSVHEHKKHTCNTCNKSFTKLSYLKIHIQGVHEHKKYTCNYCNKIFSAPNSLKFHIQSVHEHSNSYICNICNNTFSLLGNLKTHIQSVHEHKKHICNICNNTFSAPSSLKRHIQIVHENLRQFLCKYCNKSCSVSTNLKKHIQNVHKNIENIMNEQ